MTLIWGIPVHKSISRLGWIEDDFAPYVEALYDGDIALRTFMTVVKWDYEEWKDEMVQLRKIKYFAYFGLFFCKSSCRAFGNPAFCGSCMGR